MATRFSIRKTLAVAAIAVTGALSVSAMPAQAGIGFSDGSYADVSFRCESILRFMDTVSEYNGSSVVYYRVWNYFYNQGGWGTEPEWTPINTWAFGNPIPSSLRVGWIARYVQYARWTGNGWETGGHWATMHGDGVGTYWCYMD